MIQEKTIVDFIQNNKEHFQLNFSLIKPKTRFISNNSNVARMINIEKYQTKEIVINSFYKKISRTIV